MQNNHKNAVPNTPLVNASLPTRCRPSAKGLRAAIDAKCMDCIYDPKCGGGTWREQVAQCSALECPLWPVRPAPGSGPFSNPYRERRAVLQGWVDLPVGRAVSGHPSGELPPTHREGRG